MKFEKKGELKRLLLIVLMGIILLFSKTFLEIHQPRVSFQIKEIPVPRVELIKSLSLGHEGLIADFFLVRAQKYYDAMAINPEAKNIKYLRQLFSTAGQLDTDNEEVFLLAGHLLRDLDVKASNEILEEGMYFHPKQWKFPEMIGLNYFYYLDNYFLAQKYFRMASQLPNYPLFLSSLTVRSYDDHEKEREAIRILSHLYNTTKRGKFKDKINQSINKINKKIHTQNPSIRGRIIQVIDGDSLKFIPDKNSQFFSFLAKVEGLRLVGVNACEMRSDDRLERLFAHMQRDFAYYYLKNQWVTIEFQAMSGNRLRRDKYGRLLGFLFLKNGKMYQLLGLETGILKGEFRFPFKAEYKNQFVEAEKDAKLNDRGLNQFPPAFQIGIKYIDRNIGKVVTVRFLVNRITFGDRHVFLDAKLRKRNNLSIVIPFDYLDNFSKQDKKKYFNRLKNKIIWVTGFVGTYFNQAQIRIYFPSQLQLQFKKI